MPVIHVYPREDTLRPNLVHSATLHAGEQAGHSTLGVESVANFKESLRRLLGGPELDAMDFHTHGRAGTVYLGGDTLHVNALDGFRGEGFDAIFRSGATVEFLGCNVAEGSIGELFLAEFGSIFLRGRGGEVRGSNALGFQGGTYSGEVGHFWGEWVTAEVRVGGAVRLRNHSHLHPHLIRRGIGELRRNLERLTRLQGSRGRPPAPTCGSDPLDAAGELDWAETYLDGNDGRPTYRNVYFAYECLDRAARKLPPGPVEPGGPGMTAEF